MVRDGTNMSFNFPNNPVEGQVFVAVPSALTYIFSNGQWMKKADDAPVDGKLYGRKDMLWQEVASQSFPDAPTDAGYVRKGGVSGGWLPIVTIADTAPLGPYQGQLWWNSLNGNLYISYNDGTSTQWVQINNIGQ
jgi:hypothetical protein